MSEAETKADEEPFYIRQTAEPMTQIQRDQWLREVVDEARAAGAVHGRYSWHDSVPRLILYEAWRVRPRDEGSPRFALTISPTK